MQPSPCTLTLAFVTRTIFHVYLNGVVGPNICHTRISNATTRPVAHRSCPHISVLSHVSLKIYYGLPHALQQGWHATVQMTYEVVSAFTRVCQATCVLLYQNLLGDAASNIGYRGLYNILPHCYSSWEAEAWNRIQVARIDVKLMLPIVVIEAGSKSCVSFA